MNGYLPVDLDLARQLESAEGAANAAYVDARKRLEPEVRATWQVIAGVHAMFDGPLSPLTQSFGLGLSGALEDEEFDELEAFFRDRGAPVQHEVSPLIGPETLGRLNARGYQVTEFSTVMARSTHDGIVEPTQVRVRMVGAAEADLWSRTAADGWASESAELSNFIRSFGRIITHSAGVHCFLAELEGRPAAAAALSLNGGIALLAGASTIPQARRKGMQQALLHARLRFAAEAGARLAMMVAAPGSGSQRNAERQGFRVVYTRSKWRLQDR